LAFVTAPVEPLINCTCGMETKFVPVILIVVAVAGAIVWDTSATVGFVSAASIQDNWFVLEPLLAKTWFADPTEVGKIKVYDWPAEWAGDCILTPWEFWLQFKVSYPSAEEPSPLAVNLFASTVAVVSVLPAIVVGSLASFSVPEVIDEAAIADTLNVP